MNCEHVRDSLFDYADGRVADDGPVAAHLADCDECAAALQEIRAMQMTAGAWQDVSMPGWNRRAYFFEAATLVPRLALAASVASLALLLGLMAELRFGDGSLLRGEPVVTVAQLEEALASVNSQQERLVATRVESLTERQATANQFLLRTVLEASRQERREDLRDVVEVLGTVQALSAERTGESLDYLLRRQAQDQHDIGQLNAALEGLTFERGNL